MHKKLKTAVNEKDVENIYRTELLKLVPKSTITSPHQIDGLFEHGSLRMLLEFKYINQLKHKPSQCGVLVQTIFYLKRFEESGEKLPNVIFVGDINECMAVHTNAVVKYLAHEIDWKIAPSEAHRKNPTLLQAMVDDVDILPFVYDIDDKFHLKEVLEQLKDLSENVVRKVRITKHNISAIFEYFDKNVLSEKCTLNSNEKANLFMQILINGSENYLHPKKKNLLVTKSFGEIHVNQNLFDSFFAHFEGEVYSPKEKEDLTGFVDRLVEDTTRRRKGEFFTPSIWVDEAHLYMEKVFGKDWKEEYIVWDCCAATLNISRDYKFKELYCSTLEQSDIDTANQMGYNPEATKFQYDFLNDGIDDDTKIPKSLKQAFKDGKKIIFLINPPYGTANNMGTKDGDHKEGISKTLVCDLMKKENYGAATQQLYAQFLYRIQKMKQKYKCEIGLGLFSPPLFLSGGSYKKFREKFFGDFSFQDGFLFPASEFSDVAKEWGISFTVFNTDNSDNNDVDLTLKSLNKNTFVIQNDGEKTIYNTDSKLAASEWVRQELKGLKTYDAPQISSSIIIQQKGRGTLVENNLGYMINNSNNIYCNESMVSILSSCFSSANGLSIIPENFHKITTLFTARKTIDDNWINCKDEYLAPNENHPEWQQFVNDSIIYCLFDVHSQQSSLRQIQYKDKLWDIKNEFFWLSREKMMELAEQNNYDELYRDAKNGENRFVYNKLYNTEQVYDKLSPDAKEILDIATELLTKSIGIRKIVSEQHPEYHLNSFDCGWAQLKFVMKQYLKEDHDSFKIIYKKFEDRLRFMVYELEFLSK